MQMARKWLLMILAGLLVLGLLCGPFVTSRALSNVGMVVLSRALVTSPGTPDLQTLTQAEHWLRRAVAWDEGNRGAHRGLAWVMTVQGKDEEAVTEWRAGGMTAQELRVWGDQARRAKQYQEALRWYEKMALLEPGQESSALYLQYSALKAAGDEDAALAKLQEAISIDRGWLSPEIRFYVWYRWAVHLHQQDREIEAEDALTKAIAVCPQGQQVQWMLSSAYRLLGSAQQDQGKLEQAVQSLEMAVQADPDSVWAHIDLGKALYHYDAQRVAEVVREFAAALSLKADDVGTWTDLIRFWRDNREVERAASLCLEAQRKGIVSGLEGICPAP